MSCVQERSDIMGSVGSHGHTQLSNIPVLVGGRARPALHKHTNITAEMQTQHNRDGKVQMICSKQKKHC